MKAVIGKEALSMDNRLYLTFLEQFKDKFMTQGTYEARAIFKRNDSDQPSRAASWVTAHIEHHCWVGQ